MLRDSKVAKEVRSQLLNIEEKASTAVKVIDINDEMRIKKRQCRYTSPLSRYRLLLSAIIIVIFFYFISTA
uniref:hypothetical protein n=1 Tax=Bacillus cereus TaxID=1396 RepID=UPI00211D2AD3|nr:hypothetical protein [Bacillus cereus]